MELYIKKKLNIFSCVGVGCCDCGDFGADCGGGCEGDVIVVVVVVAIVVAVSVVVVMISNCLMISSYHLF